MADTFESPYMGLDIPTVGLAPGPEWATDLNNCLLTIDSHDHSTGKGVQVTPAGLNINSDLSFNFLNSAINMKTARFEPQSLPLGSAAPYQGCVYVVGSELYYNDLASNIVQITNNGSVNAGAGSITGLPSGTASASFVALSGTFVWQQATSTGANMDSATLIVRYPGSYPTPSGNYVALAAPSSLSSAYFLYLPGIPAQTNVMTLSSGGVMSSITYDQVGQGMSSTGANAIATAMNSTGADTIASKMSSTGANAIAATMTSSGANTIASTMSSPSFGGTNIRGNGKAIALWLAGSPVNENNLYIWGYIKSDGTVLSGQGISCVRNSIGNYTVSFTPSGFSNQLSVTVTPVLSSFSPLCGASNIATGNNFTAYTFNSTTGALTDTSFYFIAIGY